MRARWTFLLLAAVLAACGDDSVAEAPVSKGTVPGVGVLPEALTRSALTRSAELAPTTTASTVPRPTVTVDRAELAPIGERVAGNRLIMIGDSILASTSRRYSGQMCLGLVPLHWAVEVDAEKSRFIDFGKRVLDARLNPADGLDWDAAAVFLGTNYGNDIEVYTRQLDEILERLAPRPTLLYTVTEFLPNRADVNAAVESMLNYYPNAQLIDWAAITAADPGLLGDDGYHLSPAGITRLVEETAAAFGPAPTGEGGDCLSSRFTDDSAGSTGGGGGGGGRATTSVPSGTRPRNTTTTAAVQTTVRPVTTTSAPGGTTSSTSAPPITPTPITPPPSTQPPPTPPTPPPPPPPSPPTTTQPPPPTNPETGG